MTTQWVSATRDVQELPQRVVQERIAAIDKFGVQHHTPHRWLCIIGEELGEAIKEVNEMDLLRDRGITSVDGKVDPRMASRVRALKKELAQTAAMCIHAIEDLDGYPAECKDGNARFPDTPLHGDSARWWEIG